LIGSALTRGDVFGCLIAVVAFVLVLVAPGHCVGWATNLLGFRKRGAVQQAAWSVALSFAVAPIAAVMLEEYGSPIVVFWTAGVCGVATVGLNFWAWRQDKDKRFRWSRAIGMAIGLAWVGFVIAALVDVGVGNHLLLSVTVYDHALRSAFVDAVVRTGVPPANPLYWTGHAVPMRYYYFWYVVTASVARIAGVTARQAFIASVVWAGFGLAAIVGLFCRHFLEASEAGTDFLRRRWSRVALALALLAVTGLDILPAIAKALFRLPADADMEWWSGDQVTSWLDSVIWVPHHVAALICCLFGFLLVWMAKGQSTKQRVGCAVIAGIAFSSAFGLSIWVPLAFAMVMIAWIAWVLALERESLARVPVLLGAGGIAVVVLLPYLNELGSAPADAAVGGGASHFIEFGIRRMIDPDALLAFPWFANVARLHPMVAGSVARLILLVPGYFVELGFFGLLLVTVLMAMRRLKLDESARTSVFLVAAAVIIGTFLRSTVISSNDFGWRSMLIAQFFLLLLAVRWFEGAFGEPKRWVRGVLYASLWIGVAGTIYQQIALRVYLPVEERLGRPEEAGLATRAMALRLGFDAMDRSIPKTAIIQFNTDQPSDFFRYALVLNAQRQIANALPDCATAFGGSAADCPGIQQSVGRLFSPAGVSLTAAEARAECGRLGAGYLVATRWDSVWADSQSWVWQLPAAVETGDVRVMDCSAAK
jgi:hypothetical protein